MYDPRVDACEIIKIAAIAEKRSDHILAKAILKKAEEEGIDVPDPVNYVSVPGHGVQITYNNHPCFLGNKHFIEAAEHGNSKVPQASNMREPENYSSFYLSCSQTVYGKIYITDTLRQEARTTIDALKKVDSPT